MKNLCIVSALGQYENSVKYLQQNRSNDENHLLIIMHANGLVAEKIVTHPTVMFWEKIHIFQTVKYASSGLNSVKLNKSNSQLKSLLKKNNLLEVDEVYHGIENKLPMYNAIPQMFSPKVKQMSIEDGSATYMLEDNKIFQYMTTPAISSLDFNKKIIKDKKKPRNERGEARRWLANTLWYYVFENYKLANKQLKYKITEDFNFEKLIVSQPEMIKDTGAFKFKEIEKFDFGTFLKKEDVNYNPEGHPIFFDQTFGIPDNRHVQIIDEILQERGYKTVVVKLHPKSSQKKINAFQNPNLKTKLILEMKPISGEELVKESCPENIIGFNSSVLMNVKDVVAIDFIFADYLNKMTQAEHEKYYFLLKFMIRSSLNLEALINGSAETDYRIKCRKSVLLGLKESKQIKDIKVEKAKPEPSVKKVVHKYEKRPSKYQKDLEKKLSWYRYTIDNTEIDDKKIFFEAYKGMYACSPKELYKYFLSNPKYADYKFIWSRSFEMDAESYYQLDKDPRTTVVYNNSRKYFEELATCRLVITNQRLNKKFVKREGQHVMQTWHGTPFKRDAMSIEISTHHVDNKRRVEDNHHDVRNYDTFLVQNEFSSIELPKSFMLSDYPDVEVLKTGYPRNMSLVTAHSSDEINNLKDKYGIPKDKKVMFYTPTWRDHHKKFKNGIDKIFDFDTLRDELAEEWVILFRGHYFQKQAINLENYEGFIYDTTKYNDLNDFYLISDLLVTDYSSSFFDYLNLRKPIIFYMPDFVAYIKLSRKLHFDPETDLPGPVNYEISDFVSNVKNYIEVTASYVNEYDEYIAKYCPWDAHAIENVERELIKRGVL